MPVERQLLVGKSYFLRVGDSPLAYSLRLAFRAPHSAPTSHATSACQTTVLNNIKAVTKLEVVPKSKAKQSGNVKASKKKTADNSDSGSVIALSDEDDSQERKVALTSPEKGAEARKSVKVSQSNPTYDCLD